MKKRLMKLLLGKPLKLLNKTFGILPKNGAKTIVGAIALVVAATAQALGDVNLVFHHEQLDMMIAYLQQGLGHLAYVASIFGWAAIKVGVGHKGVKWADAKVDAKVND